MRNRLRRKDQFSRPDVPPDAGIAEHLYRERARRQSEQEHHEDQIADGRKEVVSPPTRDITPVVAMGSRLLGWSGIDCSCELWAWQRFSPDNPPILVDEREIANRHRRNLSMKLPVGKANSHVVHEAVRKTIGDRNT
jgi:hypothetical protein